MKRFLSIVLTAIMVLSVFAIGASAESSQAEKFFADLEETMSLGIKYEGYMATAYSELFGMITTSEKLIKVCENSDGTYYSKMSVSGLLGTTIINYKYVMTNEDLWVYIPNFRLKVNFEKALGIDMGDVDTSYDIEANTEMNSVLFNPMFKCLEFVSSRKDTLEKSGNKYENLTVETMKISPIKMLETAIEKETVFLPEGTDIKTLSLDEIYAYLATANGSDAESVKNMLEKASFDVYIEDGKVYDIIYNTVDSEGNKKSASYLGLGFIGVEYIYTDIDDKEFEKQLFYIDFTYIVKWILGMLLV